MVLPFEFRLAQLHKPMIFASGATVEHTIQEALFWGKRVRIKSNLISSMPFHRRLTMIEKSSTALDVAQRGFPLESTDE